MSLGRYLEGAGVNGVYANANPTLRMPQTTPVFGTAGVTRAWNDANGNFVADCDLASPSAQDLRASGGDLCGIVSNVNFGRNVLTNAFDAQILSGWGVRPSDWNFVLSLQQRIGRRSALDVAYTRRAFNGFTVADNRAVAPSDLTPFSILAPLDSRLPGPVRRARQLDETPKLLGRRWEVTELLGGRRVEPFLGERQRLGEEPVLRSEVVDDERGRRSGPFGDVGDPRVGQSPRSDHLDRGLEDLHAALVGDPPPASGAAILRCVRRGSSHHHRRHRSITVSRPPGPIPARERGSALALGRAIKYRLNVQSISR